MPKAKKEPIVKYKAVLYTVGLEYNAEGETMQEVLEKFDLKWNQIKGKGTIKIIHGKDLFEHTYNTLKLRRILCCSISRLYWARNLELLIKSK